MTKKYHLPIYHRLPRLRHDFLYLIRNTKLISINYKNKKGLIKKNIKIKTDEISLQNIQNPIETMRKAPKGEATQSAYIYKEPRK